MSAGTRIGDVLASKYRLEELLGSGGMGHVYRAVNVEIDRAVAIKVLRSEHASNATIVDRFLREARAANLVRHPNVVDVVDIGRDLDGSPFIVQELLRGEDLSKFVERRGGKLTLPELEELFLPVIDAVAEAHARGVIHRDIKPENVFLADQGRRRVPKLLDFGISKVTLPNVKATEVGVMMGTPAYMAPEQVLGARETDARSDVWALGVMLFELLAGRLPFDAVDAPALFVAIATHNIPRLVDFDPSIDPGISRVAERCLRRQPAERYPSALELARDVRHVFEGEEIEATQMRSMPPAVTVGPPKTVREARRDPPLKVSSLDVPDLALPPPKSAKTITGRPPDLPVPDPRPPGGVTRLEGTPANLIEPVGHHIAPLAIQPAPASSPLPSVPRHGPLSTPQILAAPASAPNSRPLPGVMHAGPPAAASARRPMPVSHDPGIGEEVPELSFLVAIAVIGLTTIFATALLMSFIYQPEGWPVVHYVTKPTSTLNLIAQGGLGAVAMVLMGRFALAGYRQWRGDAMGGRASAVVQAVIAGGCLFAAVELFRAAW